jgi:hypothetical protein
VTTASKGDEMQIMRCLGTDDSVNVCDCCGRKDLKATVAFELEDGEVTHFGVVCAARAMGRDAKSIRVEIRNVDRAREEEQARAARAIQDAKTARWIAHLVRMTGGIYDWDGKPNVARMIATLGGMVAARAGFAG